MKKCQNCGKDNPGNTTFCSYCGNRFATSNPLGFIAVLFGGSSVLGIGLIVLILILAISFGGDGGGGATSSNPGVSDSGNSNNSNSPTTSTLSNTPRPVPTKTIRPTTMPIVNTYRCDDLQYVKLDIGDKAKISWPKVNLRSTPRVPDDFYANVVAELLEGTSLTIIDGPECAHNGTWWEVRTSSGQTGWVREHISDGYLMKP